MSLVAWWKFRNNVNDSSGNGYTATLLGNATYSTDSLMYEYSADFDGSNAGITLLSASAAALYQNRLSISLWFKSTTNVGDAAARVFSRDCSDYYCLYVNQTGTPT